MVCTYAKASASRIDRKKDRCKVSQSSHINRFQLSCYRLGIAIGQAKQLHDDGMPPVDPTLGVADKNTPDDVPAFGSATVIIRGRLIPFADELERSTDWRELATKLVDQTLETWHWCSELSYDELYRLDSRPVETKLEELIHLLSSTIVDCSDALSETWFRLGTLIPAGNATEKYVVNQHMVVKDAELESTEYPEVPETHHPHFSLTGTGEYEWRPHHHDRIEKLCGQVGVPQCQLFPDIGITDEPDVSNNLSPEFHWAFTRIAAGIAWLCQDCGNADRRNTECGIVSNIKSQGSNCKNASRDSIESNPAHLDLQLDEERRVVTRMGKDSDPTGPRSGSDRVCRGGSWGDGPRGCRSALRSRGSPAGRVFYLGFRVSSSVPAEPVK